ncbi:MAG TPA: hypothetical protein VFE32_02765 [Puia sp.]|jgi:hypothetical protein|nr:hypothetical protein [Puia sp.]
MNFFQSLFNPNKKALSPEAPHELGSIIKLEEETEKLWKAIEETLKYYDKIACLCAFPRFRQYAGIDCVDFRASFYMSETEAFLHHCNPYFDVHQTDKGDEVCRAIYTCKKCGSTYDYGWSDFSIRVSRTYLKIKELKAVQVGSEAKDPISYYIGLFGHKLPDQGRFKKVELADFITYVRNID